jgi:hypothetical protein
MKDKKTTEISLGNLYDMNKQIMKQVTPVEKIKMFANIKNYFLSREHKYYMMLCHERRDYTVFKMKSRFSADKAITELDECFQYRGELYSAELDSNGNAIEIWLKINNEMFCYYLFPYDDAVIEV